MHEPHYIHLRLHTEYSLSDSILRIKDLCRSACDDKMPSVAITDLGNLFGMIKFFKEARNFGIKPIIGCDIWVSGDETQDQAHRMVFLVQNNNGYLNICNWISRAYLENKVNGKPVIKRDWLRASGTKGVIALSGGETGDIVSAVLTQKNSLVKKIVGVWQDLFGDRYYIEVQKLGTDKSNYIVTESMEIANKNGIPVVATHPVQFLQENDFTAHEARVCIANGDTLASVNRPKLYSRNQYLKTQNEMVELFEDFPEALANSVEIAKRCNFTFELGIPKLPIFPTPKGQDLSTYLKEESEKGLSRRLTKLYANSVKKMPFAETAYRDRLSYELRIICQMNYSGYFLVVSDFINWAKNNDIPVGPGRGSGAGSLVAFALEITDLDPLKYDLLFERFLNPERISMPDFDIDFCQDGRDKVIEYVREKYGPESVSQIATFDTMAAKAVVRDVARVMEWNYARADELAKLIPFNPGKLVTIRDARIEEPRLREKEASDEETRELLKLAEQLEGLPRNVGMHAGGVLIAPSKLIDYCPLYSLAGSQAVISQLDKSDVEEIGLVKFDFLGLTTLTILDLTIKYIKKIDSSDALSLDQIPLDDTDAYKVFANADTVAVFQFESSGMRELLAQAKPDRFEDIIALVALYRPGPMDVIPDYISRKHGQKFNYPDPRVESILKETYGIMVYQEQVMQMAQIVGGYSLGGADILRRAMGKKKPEEMSKQRNIFRRGASKNGLTQRKADEIYDLMEKFAGYGFNKSHAAAYAMVAYQTAYMKAHFTAPFMAANLSLAMDKSDRVEQLIADLKESDIEVLKPDINNSFYNFVPIDERRISFGLGAIKGAGEVAIQNIVQTRKQEAFADLFDFCERIDRRIVNRASIESLARAGAFDCIDNNRSKILGSVGLAIQAADQIARSVGQANLFAKDETRLDCKSLIATESWPVEQKFREEKKALGFYFTGHLFDVFEAEVRKFIPKRLRDFKISEGSQFVSGIIHSISLRRTQRGNMALVTLDDGSAKLDLPIFRDLYSQHSEDLVEDQLVVFQVKQDRRRPDGFNRTSRLVTEKLMNLSQARDFFSAKLKIRINGDGDSTTLKEMLTPYLNGNVSIVVHYDNGSAKADFQLGDKWNVKLEDSLVKQLSEEFSHNNIEIEY